MRFSSKAEYGLKAMTNLAAYYPGQKSSTDLAQEEEIPSKYLERLMGKLRKNALVTSTKGKGGGYALSRNPQAIAIGEIIEALEGPIAPMRCVGAFCAKRKSCPSSKVWDELGLQIRVTLYRMKLSELAKK